MKKVLLLLAAVALSASVFAADGKINFSNFDIANPTAGQPAYSPGVWNQGKTGSLNADSVNGSPGGVGAAYSVGLFRVGSTTPLYTATFFNAAGFEWGFDTSANASADVTVTGSAPGSTANLQIKVWPKSFATYEAATAANALRSDPNQGLFTSKALGGPDPGGGPDLFTPQLTGFTGLVLIPEPSTYALGIAGLGALAMMRRRK